jgi:predicted nucleic acid-binding protein
MAGLAVVLDTNVLLSGLAYPASVPGRLIAALHRTLPRLVHRHGLTPEAIDDLIDTPAILAELVELRLGLAQTLVTGDKALLTLRDRYPVCTPAEFWAEHGGL